MKSLKKQDARDIRTNASDANVQMYSPNASKLVNSHIRDNLLRKMQLLTKTGQSVACNKKLTANANHINISLNGQLPPFKNAVQMNSATSSLYSPNNLRQDTKRNSEKQSQDFSINIFLLILKHHGSMATSYLTAKYDNVWKLRGIIPIISVDIYPLDQGVNTPLH